MIKVQEIDPVKMKIITMYTTEHSKDVSYKVVTKNTPGGIQEFIAKNYYNKLFLTITFSFLAAHPHVINGKTVYLIPEND